MEITVQNSVSNVDNNEIVIRKVVCDDMSQIYDILKVGQLGHMRHWDKYVFEVLTKYLIKEAREQNAQLNWSHLPSNDEAKAFFAQFKPDITDDLDGTYIMRINLQDVNEVAAGLSKKYTNDDISVQLARREDMADINLMLREISEIRGSSNNPQLNEKDLITDGFTSSPPWFFALIAKRGSQVVGMIVGHRFYNWSPSLYMQSLYVRPSARRRGLANRLAIEFCQTAEGVEHVDLNVHPDNVEALALYRRLRAARVKATDHHVAFRLDVDRIKAEFPPETCEDA